ncbi:MAG: adenylate kinase [Actinomycetota bacterium]
MTNRRLILLGPPGAGKGTHAERLGAELNVPRIATGDMLRHEVDEGTKLGRWAKSLMDQGDLVPDEVVVKLAVKRLAREDAADGWILDGFPRNLRQAVGLDDQLEGQSVDLVIALDVPIQEVIDRISGRRMCPQGHVYHVRRDPPRREGICDEDGEPLFHRDDDNEGVARHRFEIYEKETQPLLEIYEGRGYLRRVDGAGTPDEVYPRVASLLR